MNEDVSVSIEDGDFRVSHVSELRGVHSTTPCRLSQAFLFKEIKTSDQDKIQFEMEWM